MDYKYILEPYKGMKSRHNCPACNSRDKSFARYVNIDTGEYIADHVGRCNRESKCGYHYTPKQYFEENGHLSSLNYKPAYRKPIEPVKKASNIPINAFNESLQGGKGNLFYRASNSLYGAYTANELFDLYKIGSSKRWPGAAVFWQIDLANQVRTGKIMLYNPETIKRVKDGSGKSLIDWAHRYAGIDNFNLSQCFFGEHLLTAHPNKPVAIVESEKTAIIASVHLPQFIWLACGAKTGLNDKCNVLKGRKVILYPDLGCYEDWAIKAEKYGFMISDILEKHSTDQDKENGLDLADFLIKDYLRSGVIDPNRHFLLENKIINILSGAEDSLKRDRMLTNANIVKRELEKCSRPDIINQYGEMFAPNAIKIIQSL